MMKQFLLVLVAVGAVLAEPAEKIDSHDETISTDRDRLIDTLFSSYKKNNYPDKSTVQFGFYLMNVDQDTDKDLLRTDAWLKISWTDSRLMWNPEEFGGLKNMRIPPEMVWTPDTMLYSGPSMTCTTTNTILYPNGKVLWVPPCQIVSYCNFTQDASKEQECSIKFGSWTFDGLTMGLDFFDKEDKADITNFQSQKVSVTKNEAVREEKIYPCCVEPYVSLKYTLGFEQKSK